MGYNPHPSQRARRTSPSPVDPATGAAPLICVTPPGRRPSRDGTSTASCQAKCPATFAPRARRSGFFQRLTKTFSIGTSFSSQDEAPQSRRPGGGWRAGLPRTPRRVRGVVRYAHIPTGASGCGRSPSRSSRARSRAATVYIGHLGGNFLNQLTIDSVAIRDERGELFVSTGPITLDVQSARHPRLPRVHPPRDDRASLRAPRPAQRLRLELQEDLRQQPNAADDQGSEHARAGATTSSSIRRRSTTRRCSSPCAGTPDDSLKGARARQRDPRHARESARAPCRQTFDGYGRLYAWRNINGLISHARLADPDSDEKYGREFKIASLSADEFEPTFKFRNVVGDVRAPRRFGLVPVAALRAAGVERPRRGQSLVGKRPSRALRHHHPRHFGVARRRELGVPAAADDRRRIARSRDPERSRRTCRSSTSG